MNKQAHDRITAARIHVLQDHPFFGLKLIKLDLVEDSSHPDMWVDGNSLGYNPEWAMNASLPARCARVARARFAASPTSPLPCSAR